MAKKESKKEREQRVSRILAALDREYGTEYRCYLNHETPWQLLIAVILSAQCTDARVNIVTADLFKKYDTLEKFADANLKELEQDIHSIGFYHMKAKNITHVKRISRKLGLTAEEDPEKIEYSLMEVLPKDHWILWNIHIITLGRTICTARSPKCRECFLKDDCPSAQE